MRRSGTLLMAAALLSSSPLHAAGGKWTPEQLLEHDPAWLKELGLELPASALWAPEGGGLLEAIVKVGGCSAGLVSAEGLVITNHHCVFGILQEHSTPERDLIAEGFLAVSRDDELHGVATRVTVPHRFTDVTAEIEAVAAAAADDLERYHAIDRRSKELVAACERRPFRRCEVAVYDDGVVYRLVEALEYPDVRLVWAPPRAVGEFGGEVDNWTWPRHNGDFALVRVWAGEDGMPAAHAEGNRPLRPKHFLKVAREGVTKGSFVMVAGYPAKTYRSLVATEMEERLERWFPGRARLLEDWHDMMVAAGDGDEEARILLASRVKTLANREKNARGQIAASRRGRLLEKKRAAEREALAWMAERPEHAAGTQAHAELGRLVERKAATWERDFLLEHLKYGPTVLDMTLKLTRWVMERAKPDAERHPDYQDRKRDEHLDGQRRDQKRLHPPTESLLLADFLRRLTALPESQRLATVDAFLSSPLSREGVKGGRERGFGGEGHRVDDMLSATTVYDLETRLAMFDESALQLRARRDPLVDFALDLNAEVVEIEEGEHRIEGAVSRLRPAWRSALRAFLGRPIDPDANRTLRVSLARVEGYRPRDAVWMEPQTRLAGIVEKHTGEAPFNSPQTVLEAAYEAASSRWADAGLSDVPVCFLATGDTTGGSSGSPVLNGRGELVGVNFDRVWENVANDFGYNPEIARNISADVRYLLWILDATLMPRSRALLRELGIETP